MRCKDCSSCYECGCQDLTEMFELEGKIYLGSKDKFYPFFQEQLSNWKLKVSLVLIAIVVLGLIGYILQ